MTNKRTTKQALVASVLLLCLSFSMLLGTTFAWFTDSATSAGNKIVAGTLDVQLLMHNGTDYIDISDENAPVIGDGNALFGIGDTANENATATLWEPGKTQVVYLAIKNNGNLDLKYQLAINVRDTDGDQDLYKALKYAIKDDAQPKSVTEWTDDGAKAVKVGNNVEGNNVVLKEGETKYFAFSVHMNEDAGNEFMGGSIEFDIKVLATQVASEEDSFGKDYDEDAPFGTYIELDTGADLLAAMASAQADMPLTIKLNGNVEWPTEGHHGEKDITPASDITIIGNGNTITATGSGVTPLGDTEAPMTLKDVTIVDKSASYNEGAWELTYLEMGGTGLTCDNVTFADEIQLGTNATFTNCSFESNEESVYAVWVDDGSASFTGCTFTGYRGLKMHEDYGTEISSVVVDNCTFIDIAKKPGIAIGTLNADTTVVITNNSFIGTQAGDQGNYKYETDTDVTTFNFVEADNMVAGYADTNAELSEQLKNNATVVLPEGEYSLPTMSGKEGITIIGAEDGSTVIGGENADHGFYYQNFGKNTTIKNVTFTGSSNGVRYSYANGGTSTFDNCTFAGDSTYGFHIDQSNGATFIFNNCTFSGFNAFAGDLEKVVFNNCTFLNNGNYGHTNIWSVGEFNNCTFGADTSVSTAGDSAKLYFNGVEESCYHEYIGTVKGLRNFRTSVDKSEVSKTDKYFLVNDIDLDGNYWYPIKGAFNATFDGQGYSIKNMDLAHEYISSKSNVGFFTNISTTAVIKNVTFDNANVAGEHYVGVIVGWEGNETTNATIDNCHVINSTVTCNTDASNDNGDKAGGICGYAVTLNITNCSVKDTTIKAYRDFGGILGCANGSKINVTGNTVENVTLVIDNDVNYKNYTTDAEHNANAIVGKVYAGNITNNTEK